MNASQGIVNLSLNLESLTNRPTTVSLASGVKFNAVVDGTTYVFQTQEEITATDDGAGSYSFTTADNVADIKIFEGTSTTKKHLISRRKQKMPHILFQTKLLILILLLFEVLKLHQVLRLQHLPI